MAHHFLWDCFGPVPGLELWHLKSRFDSLGILFWSWASGVPEALQWEEGKLCFNDSLAKPRVELCLTERGAEEAVAPSLLEQWAHSKVRSAEVEETLVFLSSSFIKWKQWLIKHLRNINHLENVMLVFKHLHPMCPPPQNQYF